MLCDYLEGHLHKLDKFTLSFIIASYTMAVVLLWSYSAVELTSLSLLLLLQD